MRKYAALAFRVFAFVFAVTGIVRADYKDEAGYTRLATELGAALPTGSGISVTHVEATVTGGYYMPDKSHDEFVGKTINNVTGSPTNASWHATRVGRVFYGTNTSMSGDIDTIDVYQQGNWMGSGFLMDGLNVDPMPETNRVQNHSWIGSGSSNIIRRLDYAIERDGFTCSVAVNNGSGTSIPQLLAHSYNAIVVGRTDGNHSSGDTTFDVAGRMKPDIVAPASPFSSAISYSTPMISSAAALLMEAIDGDSSLINAASPQTIKAILLSGATKEEIPSWSRTPAHPIDDHYGVGELNIYNSYHTLVSGEKGSSVTGIVSGIGWDSAAISSGTNAFYFFDVPESNVMTRLSVVLVWNREITDGDPGIVFDPLASVANLDLHLHESTNLTTHTLIDTSTSIVDNVEHIYLKNLTAGQYAIEVEAHDTEDYALAWFSRTSVIPEISTMSISNGNVGFSAVVTPNIPYGIEASTNLINPLLWAVIDTNTSATNVLFYEDDESGSHPLRFYRLIPDP